MYKDATDLSTYLQRDYYKCFDGTCIDIKHIANKDSFQTAKTLNNSLALHTVRSPRTSEIRSFGTDSLQSIMDYSTKETSNISGYFFNPAYSGVPSYTKGPFGDSMSYSGLSTSKDSYSNIKFKTVLANASDYPEGPAQAGIGFFRGPDEGREADRPALPFQQSTI
jgi:hypothetical protein